MADKDFLAMTDEDFSKLDINDLTFDETTEEENHNDDDDQDTDEEESEEVQESTESDKDESSEEESTEEEEESSEETESDESKTVEESTEEKKPKDKQAKTETTVTDKKEVKTEVTVDIDYKAAYEKLTAPFKANGSELKIDNVDEAITLMQKGANYNSKMQALKPNLKIMKALDKAGLLNEDKINHLIDLARHDKNAITKLLADSKINPLDIDTEDAKDYVPGNHGVTDLEMRFNDVLAEIATTPTYDRTIKVISSEFDPKSKALLSESPDKIAVINNHMSTGLYDVVKREVTKQRLLGKISDSLSELEAYEHVGSMLYESGALTEYFGEKESQKPNQQQKAGTTNKPPVKKDSAQEDIKNRKKAVAPTSAKKSAQAADFNPLGMSDDEFLKQFG
jgi:hypothetical protein